MSQQNAPASQVRIRAATEADISFLFNSWLRSYRQSEFAKQMQNEVYFAAQHKVIEGLLKTCKTLIACNHADISQIYGYTVTTEVDGVPVVHFAYVKEPYRGLGLARKLLQEAGISLEKPYCYTHKTFKAGLLERKHAIVYHPYLAFHAYEAAK